MDTVVLEGLVLDHLLNSIVTQTFLSLRRKLDLPRKPPRSPHPFQSVCQTQHDSSNRNVPRWLVISTVPMMSPLPKGVAGLCGAVEVKYSWALSFPRTLAGTGKPFNPCAPPLLGMGPALEVWGLRFSFSRTGGLLIRQLLPVIHFILRGSRSVKESALRQRKPRCKSQVILGIWETPHSKSFHFE